MSNYIDIVFDGPPSHESGRFVEVEDSTGKSIRFGEWVEREDGYWALRIPDQDEAVKAARVKALEEVRGMADEYAAFALMSALDNLIKASQ